MEEAEKICGCRPWDYPSAQTICDFYGSSCFNSVIENGLAQVCQKKCIPGCNEIKYTISMEKEILDENKICDRQPHLHKYDMSLFDVTLERYIMNDTRSRGDGIKRFQEAIMKAKNSSALDIEYWKQKMRYDIAIVNVVINTPTVVKFVQNKRVTIADQLANFGKSFYPLDCHGIPTICLLVCT